MMIYGIYPQPIRRHDHPKYTFITLARVSYLRSLVVRAVHRHRTGVGSIPAGGPIVDEFFSTVPGQNSDMCIFPLGTKTNILLECVHVGIERRAPPPPPRSLPTKEVCSISSRSNITIIRPNGLYVYNNKNPNLESFRPVSTLAQKLEHASRGGPVHVDHESVLRISLRLIFGWPHWPNTALPLCNAGFRIDLKPVFHLANLFERTEKKAT